MPSVIQELTGEDVTLDYAHVYERVTDWETRIAGLYADVITWFSPLRSDRSETVEMNEELMRAYGVASVRLPVLRIFDEFDQVAKFVPRGLWIIGANGRIDLFAKRGQFIIVDRSEYFSSPIWEIAPSLRRLEPSSLSKENLLQTIQ